MLRCVLYLLFLCLLPTCIWSQNLVRIIFQNDQKILFEKKTVNDSISIRRSLDFFMDSLQNQGYLSAYIKDVNNLDSLIICTISPGRIYYYLLDYSALPSEHLKEIALKEGVLLRVSSVKKNISEWTVNFQNQGYYFAKVYLDSIQVIDSVIHSKLKAELGARFYIDSIRFKSREAASDKFIRKLVSLKKNEVYSPMALKASLEKLNYFPFLLLASDPKVSFYRQSATIEIDIKELKQSRIDAVLGVLPSSASDQKLKLNGTANAVLINQFKMGESISFNFQSLQNNSQQLKTELQIPYIFNFPFNTGFKFHLYRRDSLFLDSNGEFNLSVFSGNRSEFKLSVGSWASSLISPDLHQIVKSKQLPGALDIRQNFTTISLSKNVLPYKAFRRRGYNLSFFLSAIRRKIVPNAQIVALKSQEDPTFSFKSLYTSFNKPRAAFESGITFEYQVPLGRYGMFYQHARSYMKASTTTLRLNEFYRIGGFYSLRGFDEESIFTTRYTLVKSEYRLLTGTSNYLFIHSDGALAKVYSTEVFKNTAFVSMGAGLAINTPMGLLSIATSIGNRLPEGFNWRAFKVHIGYSGGF